jgi:hypothetical protein
MKTLIKLLGFMLNLVRVALIYILSGLVYVLSKGTMITIKTTAKGTLMVGKHTVTRIG